MLTKVFCTSGPNLVMLVAWMGDESSRGHTHDWYRQTDWRTDGHTDAGNNNNQRPKLASANNFHFCGFSWRDNYSCRSVYVNLLSIRYSRTYIVNENVMTKMYSWKWQVTLTRAKLYISFVIFLTSSLSLSVFRVCPRSMVLIPISASSWSM